MTRGQYNVNSDNDQEESPKLRRNGNIQQENTNKVESVEILSAKEKPYYGYGFTEVKFLLIFYAL